MRPVPFRPMIPAPSVLGELAERPLALATLTLGDLCAAAGIPLRVTSEFLPTIVCTAGMEHYVDDSTYYVGVGKWRPTRVAALRVLEVLAHGFHDYAARECVCGKGLFSVPRPKGRRPRGSLAMTARERMAAMRLRRAAR